MNKIKIYLASPYTSKYVNEMEERFRAACRAAGDLMNSGYLVFSPIAHTHPIAVVCDLPRHADFWMEYDETFIEWCDELWVLGIDGYKESKGIKAEVRIAEKLGKPIKLYMAYLQGAQPMKGLDT